MNKRDFAEGRAMSVPNHERNERTEYIIRDEAMIVQEREKTARFQMGLPYWLGGLALTITAEVLIVVLVFG
ncbi:MAG: hypothetical protein V7676_17530 [Parasphingorhabdus sp.]|jgi:hypothetical protein|uniref:hypothetical protein n=1 Tax=Parasphingorhabdus sp. TaxID=2709688 RepID=UPI0030010198